MRKTIQDNNVIDSTGTTTLKSELNYHDWSDYMQSIVKTRQDNGVTDCKVVIFMEYNIELSRLIG